MFSDTVLSLLRQSGWRPNRRWPTGQWVRELESEGFVMVPTAASVLETFGGLELAPPKLASDTFLKGRLHFDPVIAASGEFDRVNYWQERLNTRFSPLAEGSRGEIFLLAENGGVCACYEQ